MENTNNNEVKKNSRKASKKGTFKDGKYIPSDEQKKQYLETYKNNPCYSMVINCPLCNAQYIKGAEFKHLTTKKHLLNLTSYEEAKKYFLENNINDEDEQLKFFNEFKQKNLYKNYLEKMQMKKPEYFENYKLFDSLKTVK